MDAKQIAAQLARELHYLDMPIGVYVVATDGQFIACNRPVREMLGLPLDGEANASLAQFYAEATTRNKLLRLVTEAETRGTFLQKEIIHLQVGGRDLYVEDYCRSLRDPATNQVVGYLGCLADVTIEYEAQKREGQLQNKVEELTFDIGRILHANTSTLLMAQQTLDSVAEALSQRELRQIIGTSFEDLDEQLVKEAEQVAGVLEKLAQGSDATRRAQALPEHKWDEKKKKIAPLRQVRETIPGFEMRVPALRSVAHQIIMVCREMAPGALPRELVKDVLRATAQLENTACLADVLMSRMAIVQMDATLRSLRDFVTADIRTHEEKKRLSVKVLIEQTITQMAEFARTSRVEIHRKERDFDVEVEGIERDVTRALANLLHNAIKYSWRRDRFKSPWVTVRAFTRDGNACIEFENWGVPIAQEEIENGLIFQLGYRGKWSKDRGRLGTGIGLTDAKRTAEANHGSLHVASRPANPGWIHPDDRDYFSQPFITTVTFCLPALTERRR